MRTNPSHNGGEQPRKRPWRKQLERWAGSQIVLGLHGIVRRLPPRATSRWGHVVGAALHALSRRYREMARHNLRLAFPAMEEAEVRHLCRRMFINFGKTTMEFLRIPYMSPEEIDQRIQIEGREHLDAALAAGKGALLITAHFGNWELIGARLRLDGYQVDAIARRTGRDDTTELMSAVRQSKGMRVFFKDEVLPAVRALKQNHILAILPDQHDYDGIFVEFFGQPAMTATGPATIALMTGAPLVPMFTFRREDDSLCGRFYPPLVPESSGDREADVRRLTQWITRLIEARIREAPDHWLWLHDRWKTTREPALLAAHQEKRRATAAKGVHHDA